MTTQRVARRHPSSTWSVVASVWCGAFAIVHLYWAVGGRIGVPAGTESIARRPIFLAYDLVAAGGLAGLAVLLLPSVRDRLRSPWSSRARLLVAISAGLLLLRGVVGLIQDVMIALGGDSPGVGVVFDVWFTLAGVLVACGGRTYGRAGAVC